MLPVVPVPGMIWPVAREARCPDDGGAHSATTFWYVPPSLPMCLLIPVLLRHGLPFWLALTIGCMPTVTL